MMTHTLLNSKICTELHFCDQIVAIPLLLMLCSPDKAQVTLCRSGGPDLCDLKNRGHRYGRLMKSWQHRTDILEVGTRSAVIGKPVRQSFTVKLFRVGRDCGYDLFMDRFQSCVESETSWDCRTRREGIRGQRVGIRGQRMDGREDRINITIARA